MINNKNKKILFAVFFAMIACLAVGLVATEHTSETSDAASSSFTKTIQANTTYSNEVVWTFSGSGSGAIGGWGPTNQFPPGISFTTKVANNKMSLVLNGSTGWVGSTQLYFWQGELAATNQMYFDLVVNPGTITVTYDANGGLVKGNTTWTEPVVSGGHPTVPAATFSNGSQIFQGWATSSTATTPNFTSNSVVTAPITVYAVWTQASTSISSWSATVSNGQTFGHTFTVTPSNATISISSSPAGWGVSISGSNLSGTVPTGSNPGNNFIVLKISASGFATTTQTIIINVPAYAIPPIEKQQAQGTTFSWEPVTNPNNATITINSVKLDGNTLTNSGFAMVGRTITGPLSNVGTYVISFNISASGYTSSTSTVSVYAFAPVATIDPPGISSINANQRSGVDRTWDFIAVNPINYASISWKVQGGPVFQTSSTTAVYQFPTAGSYTVECDLLGLDGSTVSKTKTIMVTDAYYPELAWVGVPYAVSFTGTPATDMLTALWLSASTNTIDTQTYTVVSGTPTSSHAGFQYSYSVAATTYDVTVYAAQTVAPTAIFNVAYASDQMSVTVTWTGFNASVVYYDYGDGTPQTTSTTHTYATSGAFTLTATAVNNIAVRTSSVPVFTGGYDEEIPSTDPLKLTDVTYHQGEKVFIPLTLKTGDEITLLGTATAFVSYEEPNIVGDTADVELGDYDLTVTYTPAGGGTPIQHTIKISIDPPEQPPINGGPATVDYLTYVYEIIAFFVLILVIYIVYKVIKSRKKGKKK